MGQSSRELNKAYWQGTGPSIVTAESTTSSNSRTGSPAPGSSGSGWRMTKLKRTFEAAEEEGKPIEQVAMERYGSLEAFEQAKEEKRILDERDSNRRGGGGKRSIARDGTSTPRGGKFVFTETMDNRARTPESSRNAFRRPGEAQQPPPLLSRSTSTQSIRGGGGGSSSSRPSTPVPSVFTPPISRTPLIRSNLSQSTTTTTTTTGLLNPDPTATTGPMNSSDKPILSQSELNKLQAKVLKAKLMDDESAKVLESEYETELKRFQQQQQAGPPPIVENHEGISRGQEGTQVQVLPTLDARGRMYDTGIGTGVADKWEKERIEKGGRGKKEKVNKILSHCLLPLSKLF